MERRCAAQYLAADGEIDNKLTQNGIQVQSFTNQQFKRWGKRQASKMHVRRLEILNLLTSSLTEHLRNEWKLKLQCDETPFTCFRAALDAQWHATRQCESQVIACTRAKSIAALPCHCTITRERTEYKKRVVQGNNERDVPAINEFLMSPHTVALHQRYWDTILIYTDLVFNVYAIEAMALPQLVTGALRVLCDEIYGTWLQLRHAARTREHVVGAIDDVSRFIKKLRDLI